MAHVISILKVVLHELPQFLNQSITLYHMFVESVQKSVSLSLFANVQYQECIWMNMLDGTNQAFLDRMEDWGS